MKKGRYSAITTKELEETLRWCAWKSGLEKPLEAYTDKWDNVDNIEKRNYRNIAMSALRVEIGEAIKLGAEEFDEERYKERGDKPYLNEYLQKRAKRNTVRNAVYSSERANRLEDYLEEKGLDVFDYNNDRDKIIDTIKSTLSPEAWKDMINYVAADILNELPKFEKESRKEKKKGFFVRAREKVSGLFKRKPKLEFAFS